MKSMAKRALAQEASALYNDATSGAARARIASQAVQKGDAYTFPDGSKIVIDSYQCCVYATDAK